MLRNITEDKARVLCPRVKGSVVVQWVHHWFYMQSHWIHLLLPQSMALETGVTINCT